MGSFILPPETLSPILQLQKAEAATVQALTRLSFIKIDQDNVNPKVYNFLRKVDSVLAKAQEMSTMFLPKQIQYRPATTRLLLSTRLSALCVKDTAAEDETSSISYSNDKPSQGNGYRGGRNESYRGGGGRGRGGRGRGRGQRGRGYFNPRFTQYSGNTRNDRY